MDGNGRQRSALKRETKDLESKKEGLQIILTAIKNRSKPEADKIVQMIRTNEDENFDVISQVVQKFRLTSIGGPGIPDDNYNKLLLSPSEQPPYGEHSFPNLNLGEWTNVTDDPNLVKHLLDLYFAWSHPFYVLFLEEFFYLGLHDRNPKYSTPLLVNAVLAVGCLYSDLPATRTVVNDPKTSGDHFFAEAKKLLAAERRPSVANVAALGVMSIRESMKGDTSSGLEFARQMMSMSAELGLHMDQTTLGPFRSMTVAEIETRRVTFWGTYAVETTSTMCLGRISGLPRIAVKIEKPYPHPLEKKVWKPHGHRHSLNTSLGLEQPSVTYSLARQLCCLTEIVNDASHLLYAPRSGNAEQRLRQLYQRYEAWHLNLPDHLNIKWGSPTLPQVIALQ